MKIYGCYLTTTYVSFVFVYKVDHLWKKSETNNVKSVKERVLDKRSKCGVIHHVQYRIMC